MHVLCLERLLRQLSDNRSLSLIAKPTHDNDTISDANDILFKTKTKTCQRSYVIAFKK